MLDIRCIRMCLVAWLLLPHAAAARQTLADLRVGSEVRLYTPRDSLQHLRGVIVAPPTTTLLVARGIDTTAVELKTVLRLDVRARRRSVWRPAAAFGLAGLAAGALAVPLTRGLVCHPFNPCRPLTTARTLAVVGGIGAAMAGMGIIIGVVENEARPWYPVYLPDEQPAGPGVVRVGIRVAL